MNPFSIPPELPAVRETINTLRLLAVDAVEQANSGHPGTPMEAAPLVYLLFTRHLRHNPANPQWPGRDRFVLSCGHASMLLYAILHLCGYDLSLEELRNFRQFGSKTPGHPEFGHTPGVETTTGPLGQGFGTAVGMALGGRFLADRIDSELFHYRVFTLCSDGDMMEGVASETASLAGHLRLGNLTAIYLDNRITIEGSTSLAFSEDVHNRFQSYGWHVQRIDGEDLAAIDSAFQACEEDPRPSLIIARTHIASGAPTKQDTAEAHGAPLGGEEVAAIKTGMGRNPDRTFDVPPMVRDHMAAVRDRGEELEVNWQNRVDRLPSPAGASLATRLQMLQGLLPDGWDRDLPRFEATDGPMATRKASGIVLNALADRLPLLLGGSADLAPSNYTLLDAELSWRADQVGRNLHFGVREHAMGAILNGLALTPGLVPFGGTFLIFTDYMRPPIRLAAMMGIAPIYVLTHDSIGLGEDGPTHQPVEQLPGLRAVPNLTVIRPCDANETIESWHAAIAYRKGPTALILSRQNLPILDRTELAPAEGLRRGGYILAREEGALQVILIASGSEVHPALKARDHLQTGGRGTRVVSLPSWELFEAQDQAYRNEILPPACRVRVGIEAASPLGWERYIGDSGTMVAMEGFGASAPGPVLLNHFGFSVENIIARVHELLAKQF